MNKLILKIYGSVIRHLPIYSGLTKLSFNPLVNKLIHPGQVIAVTRDGVEILVDLEDFDGRLLYIFGANDRKILYVVNQLLEKDVVFLDIGANYGSVGFSASRYAKEVHLFEPQSRLCGRIEQAISNAGLTNVTLHRLGLLDKDASLVLSIPKNHSGKASVVNHDDNWNSETITVRDTASYVSSLVKDNLFGVKIDIEGAEMKVLPALLAMENLKFAVCEANQNEQELFDLARKFKFEVYGICKTILKPKLQKITSPEEMSVFHDILFKRDS